MARHFTKASSAYMETLNSMPATAMPLTWAAWIYPVATPASTGLDNNWNIFDMCKRFVSSPQYFEVVLRGDAGGGYTVMARQTKGSTITGATSPSGIGANKWIHAAGRFTSSTLRDAFLNGQKGSNTTSNNQPTGFDRFGFGCSRHATAGNQVSGCFDGRIAEAGFWNVALSDGEILALASGCPVLQVRPGNLVAYYPLWGVDSSERCVICPTFSVTGSGVSQANHAPVASLAWGDWEWWEQWQQSSTAFLRTLTESFSFSDSASRAAGYGRPSSESFSFSDLVSRAAAYARSVQESFSFSDLVSRVAAYFRSSTEALSFSDLVSRAASYFKPSQESLSFSDLVSRAAGYLRTSTESFSFSDLLSRSATYFRGLTESFSFSDLVSFVKGGAGAFVRSLSEDFSSSFSDSVSRVAAYLRSDIESFSFLDSVSTAAGLKRSVTEALSFSDVASRSIGILRTLVESFSFSDLISRVKGSVRAAQESLSFSDSVSRAAAYRRTSSESFSFSDLVSILSNVASIITRIVVLVLKALGLVSVRSARAGVSVRSASATVSVRAAAPTTQVRSPAPGVGVRAYPDV